jgi:3-oxoacyl-[acyl-carrier-protein] synthase-3
MQDKLSLPTYCGALDFNLGCSGYIYGLSLAKGLIISNISKNILLITSETYSKHLHPKDKGNRTIFGDAAAATLISTDGFAEICNFSLGTDGKGAENLIVKTGAFRAKKEKNDLIFDINNFPKSSGYLFMDGSEIFNFTAKAVPALVGNILEINSLTQEEVDLFVFHQANKFMINFLRKQLKISKDKFFVFMENVGNTVSCTIPITLHEAQKQGVLKGNTLLAGFGVGYSWGGTILKIKN